MSVVNLIELILLKVFVAFYTCDVIFWCSVVGLNFFKHNIDNINMRIILDDGGYYIYRYLLPTMNYDQYDRLACDVDNIKNIFIQKYFFCLKIVRTSKKLTRHT